MTYHSLSVKGSGANKYGYQLQLSGQIGMVGIVFRPAGLHTLFGMPMYEFSDERTNLRDVLGICVDEYSDKIEEASSHGERLALLAICQRTVSS